jgi:hypothetical protein
MTSAENPPTVDLTALSPRERQRLRLLATRYRMRRDTTPRPMADVMFDLRLRHGVHLSMGQVSELLNDSHPPPAAPAG